MGGILLLHLLPFRSIILRGGYCQAKKEKNAMVQIRVTLLRSCGLVVCVVSLYIYDG
jgi:hypothetical protein